MHTPANIETSWPDAIYAHFRRVGIRQVGYVPDAGHSRLIALCQADPNIADVVLTTEEEGVGLVAGAALGGAARGAADAVERRRQLHQHVFAAAQLRLRLRHAGDHARRIRRIQPVAGADGRDHRRDAAARRLSHLSDRERRRCRRHRRRRLRHGVRRQSAGRNSALAAADRPQSSGRDKDKKGCSTGATSCGSCWSIAATFSSSAGSARRPTMSPRPAIIRSISISGARWAAPR